MTTMGAGLPLSVGIILTHGWASSGGALLLTLSEGTVGGAVHWGRSVRVRRGREGAVQVKRVRGRILWRDTCVACCPDWVRIGRALALLWTRGAERAQGRARWDAQRPPALGAVAGHPGQALGSVTLGVTLSVTLGVTVTVPVRVSERDSPSPLVMGVTGSAAVVVMGCTRWTLSTATCAARLSPSSSSTAILADHNSLTSQP